MQKSRMTKAVLTAGMLAAVATGCVLTPFPNQTIAHPFANVNFSGFTGTPGQTVRVQYQTPNGIWNNVGTTMSANVATDGVYNWSLTDDIPQAGWGPHGNDYQTKIRVQNLSSGDNLPFRNGEYVLTLYAAGPAG